MSAPLFGGGGPDRRRREGREPRPRARPSGRPAVGAGRIAVALMLLGLVGGLVAGCRTMGLTGGDVLRVGVSPDYPPVVFERDGEIVGIEADFARLVGNALDRPIVFERFAFPQLLDVLEAGRVDIVMSGVSITPERARRVLFTQPYMQAGQLLLIRAADVARFGRAEGIRHGGARIGYERGTTGERFVAEELDRSRSFAFDSVQEGLRSLRAGRIDYFIHDAPTVWRIAGDPKHRDLMGLYQPLTRESLAWAVQLENEPLKRQLDDLVLQWRREGLIDRVLDRWIPVRVIVR